MRLAAGAAGGVMAACGMRRARSRESAVCSPPPEQEFTDRDLTFRPGARDSAACPHRDLAC